MNNYNYTSTIGSNQDYSALFVSLHQQLEEDNNGPNRFINDRVFLIWYFTYWNNGRNPDGIKYATVYNYLIGVEAAEFSKKDKEGYFQCTTSFTDEDLFLTDDSFKPILDKLQEDNLLTYCKRITKTGCRRFIKLNHNKVRQIRFLYTQFIEEKRLAKQEKREFNAKKFSVELISGFQAKPDTPFRLTQIPVSGQDGHPSLSNTDTPIRLGRINNINNNINDNIEN